jgi:hypothetical protein
VQDPFFLGDKGKKIHHALKMRKRKLHPKTPAKTTGTVFERRRNAELSTLEQTMHMDKIEPTALTSHVKSNLGDTPS